MGSEALLTRFLGRFLEDGNMDALRAAVAAGAWDKALTASHTLKGMSGNLSMTVLYDLFHPAGGPAAAARHSRAAALMPAIEAAYQKAAAGHPGDVNMAGPKKGRWLALWKKLRYYIAATAVLVGAGIGFFLFLRRILLVNYQGLETLLAQNYAAEVEGDLDIYKALIEMAADGVDARIEEGEPAGELERWIGRYSDRLQKIFGEDMVDVYAVYDRRSWRPTPGKGTPAYDYASTEWYQQAMAAGGRAHHHRRIHRCDLRPGCADGGPAVRPQRYRGGL